MVVVYTKPMWQGWITSDPNVLSGKAVVKGTRLAVSFLLGLLAQGWTEEQILDNYPQLPREGLRAAIRYAQDSVDEALFLEVSR
jgi:uncharacterized protein (DUF433 family)